MSKANVSPGPLTVREEWRRGGSVVFSTHIGMAVGAGVYSFVSSLFVVPVSDALEWSRGEISGAAAFGMIGAFSAPLIGRLADRFGTKTVALAMVFLLGLNFVGMSQMSGPFYQFVILSLVFGFVAPGTSSLIYSRAVSGWFDKGRGQAMGIMAAGMSVGGLLFTPLVAWAISGYGFEGGFLTMAALAWGLGLPAVAFGVRDATRTGVTRESEQSPVGAYDHAVVAKQSVWKIMRSRSFLALAFAVFATNAPGAGFITQLSPLLEQNRVESPILLISLFSVVVLIGRIGIGYLFDRFDARWVAAVFSILAIIGSLIFLSWVPVALAIVGIILMGFLQGMETDVTGYFVARNFDHSQFGILAGLLYTSTMLGNAVGVVGFGVIYDMTKSYDLAMISAAVMLVGAAIAYLMIPNIAREPVGQGTVTSR